MSVGWISNRCDPLKVFHELISMEPIQMRGTLESIKRLQSWKDNGMGWHGWVILFLNQQLCLNIDANKAENSESRTALNSSLSNVTLAISQAVPGYAKGRKSDWSLCCPVFGLLGLSNYCKGWCSLKVILFSVLDGIGQAVPLELQRKTSIKPHMWWRSFL